MISLSIDGLLGKTITPAMGIAESELTAMRTPVRRAIEQFLEERKEGDHAWGLDPYAKKVIAQVKETAAAVKRSRVETVLWLGIGGSGLGPKVLQEAFELPASVEFVVVDTIDPAALKVITDVVDWSKTLVVVVSKSGETLETMSAFFLCWDRLKKARKALAKDRVIAITDPKEGALKTFCLEQGIETLPIQPGVGGRYCIFSPVGLLPIALLGGDVDAFVRGAKAMDTRCQSTVLEENPAALLAASQWLLDTKKHYPIRVIMPYGHRLQSLGRWNQQLIAESLGKAETQNPIPMAALGTQDQHSLLQQWLAGPRRCWHLIVREKEHPELRLPEITDPAFRWLSKRSFGDLLDACTEGTAGALTAQKRPHAMLTLDRLDEENLGALFFLLLTEVVLLGKLYRLNPYGQPAVELGKKRTRQILGIDQ